MAGRGKYVPPSFEQIDRLAGASGALNEQLGQLALAAAKGNEAAIDRLLYAVDSQRLAEPGIRRILINPSEVDDVNQEVLIAVAEHIGNFRNESKFTTWLFGVARNKALEYLRRKKETVEFRSELGDVGRISSMIASDVSIQELLRALPEHYRLAVTMRDLDGMAYQDIAAALDLNINTVRAHISRGRALLAACATGQV